MPVGQSLNAYLVGFRTNCFVARWRGTILRAEFFACETSHRTYLPTILGDFSMTKLLKKVALMAVPYFMLTFLKIASFLARWLRWPT